MRISDWSSDVCSSDLLAQDVAQLLGADLCQLRGSPAGEIAHTLNGPVWSGVNWIRLTVLREPARSIQPVACAPRHAGAAQHRRSTISCLISPIALAGLRPFGQETGRRSCGERVCSEGEERG